MKKYSSLFQLVSAMLIFGTIGVFVKYIPLPSGIIAMARGFTGVAFLLIVILIKKQKLNKEALKANLLKLVVSGAFIGFNWIFLFEAIIIQPLQPQHSATTLHRFL